MYTLLIVEDEKMIRQGIKAIAMRSGVPFARILECRNGEEGLTALLEEPVDLMITDIRMPKMDGITLVERAKAEGRLPLTIVLSGYDDFSYAVALLRAGVQDYILKPVDRQKLTELLHAMAGRLQQAEMARSNAHQLGISQLKYLLLNHALGEAETNAIVTEFTAQYGDGPYCLYCANALPDALPDACIILPSIADHWVIYSPEAAVSATDAALSGLYAGKSRTHASIRQMRNAHTEAMAARHEAFARAAQGVQYSAEPAYAKTIPADLPERQTQAISAHHFEAIATEWGAVAAAIREGSTSPEALSGCVSELLGRITAAYQSVVPVKESEITPLWHPLQQDTLDDYMALLLAWLEAYDQALGGELSEYHNRQRIDRARAYIDQNFTKDLNMAIVSNMVSMNYSLFSAMFKQFTGEGFAAYIKRLRIEQAKALLRDTDLMILEIGRRVGYENDKHFLKLFKAMCGVSPSEYRAYARIEDEA